MSSRSADIGSSTMASSTTDSAAIGRLADIEPFDPADSIRGSQPFTGALWRGWRLRILALAALAGCIGALLLAEWVAGQPQVDARWRADPASQLELVSSQDPDLRAYIGQRLQAIVTPQDRIVFSDATALTAAPRWTVSNASRAALETFHTRLHQAFSSPAVTLLFKNGESVQVATRASGIASLSIGFWLTCSAVLMLYLVAIVVVLTNPQPHTLLFALIATCQALNMGFIATETALQWGFPPELTRFDAPWRSTSDLMTGAAIFHVATIHPRRLPASTIASTGVWLVTLLLCIGWFAGVLPEAWWWTQIGVTTMSVGALLLLTWSHHIEAHPYSLMLRTVGVLALSGWLMLSGFSVLAEHLPGLRVHVQSIGPMLWSMVFISLLLLVPFVSQSRVALREFALVAGVSTFAAIVDLLLVAFFAFGPLGSVALTFFLAIGLYAAARHWLLDNLLGRRTLSTERMFEQLYRIAREVEVHPQHARVLLVQLLQDLFEPLEASTVPAVVGDTASVRAGGSAMLIPADLAATENDQPATSIVLRFAHRGRRLFTAEDARLAERIVEQLRRAIAFDRAVEHGRLEERLRLAQDLHDDIGARLLTLMYQSKTAEIEEYVRHTLQDLKTLTRGLSTADHRLSHSAAEWKADLHQRLSAAGISMRWECDYDSDVVLSVVQWSALTRILRELVSNSIAHARASRVEVSLHLSYGQLEIRVSDNGRGSGPDKWSHGLGMGGVRKRVKQLAGQVSWLQLRPSGICCVVRIAEFAVRA